MRTIILFIAILVSITFNDKAEAFEKNKMVRLKICSIETGFGKYTTPSGDGLWQNLVRESLKDLNINLVMIFAPRERCLKWARKNDVDAVYAAQTEGRNLYLNYPKLQQGPADVSKVLGIVQFKIYVKKSSNVTWDGKKFTNLADNAIGVQRGLQIEQTLRDNKVKVDGDLVSTPEQNLTKLHLGRIVAAAVEESAGDEVIRTSGFNDLVKLEKSYSHSDVYLAFSNAFYKNNNELVEKIWNNIKTNKRKNKIFPARINFDPNILMVQL